MVKSIEGYAGKNKDPLQLLFRRFGLIVLAFVIIILLTLGNHQFTASQPGGNDFFIPWMGARSFLTEGLNPYSDEVAARTTIQVYGRPAQNGEAEQRIPYPIYFIFLYAPFAIIPDYALSRAVWMAFLEVALIAAAFINLNLVGWKPNRLLLLIYLVFSITWYHAFRSLINGNLVVIITLAVSASLWLIQKRKDALAGIVLGLATMKPNIVLIVIIWISLWAILSHRWRIIAGIICTVLGLSTVWMFIFPDWLIQNFHEIMRYPTYPPGNIAGVLAGWWSEPGQWVGWLISLSMVGLLIFEWSRRGAGQSDRFLWITCLTLVISQWSGITTDPGNFLIMFLPLTLIVANLDKRRGNALSILFLGFILISIWALFLFTIPDSNHPLQNPVMFFPIPTILLIGLYLIRNQYTKYTKYLTGETLSDYS